MSHSSPTASVKRSPTRSWAGKTATPWFLSGRCRPGISSSSPPPDFLPLTDRVAEGHAHHRARLTVRAPLEDGADEALDAESGVLPREMETCAYCVRTATLVELCEMPSASLKRR